MYRGDLHLHHKTYERLGCERDDDVELLCTNCHADADKERAKSSQERSEVALYSARLDGWATKKYGEDWEAAGDPQQIEEEFSDFLERVEE